MSRHIFAGLAIALSWFGSTARAGVYDGTTALWATTALAQADAGGDPARKQVDDLLARARQAMTDRNWETADSLVARAEAINVTYGIFHTGDTPKKARRDLDKSRPAGSAQTQTRAGDPFAGHSAGASAAVANSAGMPPAMSSPIGGYGAADGRTPFNRPLETTPPPAGASMQTSAGTTVQLPTFNPSTVTTTVAAPIVDPYVRPASNLEVVRNQVTVASNPDLVQHPKVVMFNGSQQFPDNSQNPAVIPLPQTSAVAEVRVIGETPAPFNAGPAAPVADNGPKQKVIELVRNARAALNAGNMQQAETLAREADAVGVADKEFGPQDDRAWLVLWEIEKLRRRGGGVVQASGAASNGSQFPGAQAVYDPNNDATRNIPANAQLQPVPTPAPPAPPALIGNESESLKSLNSGDEALRRGDLQAAQRFFAAALQGAQELDPVNRQRLQDRLSHVGGSEPIGPGHDANGLIDQAAQAQSLYVRQISSEVGRLEQQAAAAQENDPGQAQAILQQARVMVEKSTLDGANKDLLLRRLDRDLGELNRFVETNRPRLELIQQNRETQATMDREQQAKLDGQQRLAKLVDEYNTLIDQQRFAEAEVAAKRAAEIAPNEPISAQLLVQSKALRRLWNNGNIRNDREDSNVALMSNIDASAVTGDLDASPMQFARNWIDLTKSRGPLGGDTRRRTPKELEIEQRLKTPVSLKFANAPLAQVFEKLSQMTGVPIYVDHRGLAAEGVDSSTPVSIDLTTEIQLKSALNLILAEHHLTYVIKNEVLKITSDRMRSEEVYSVTYPVGDLVIPIPNFVPTGRMGLAGALADAQANVTSGGIGLASHAPLSVMATAGMNADFNSSVLGQVNIPFAAGGGGPPATGMQQNVPFGPGGMGGGVKPDFDSLVELVTSTIAPESWRESGGTQGEVKSHASTLSLVITQTQAVHEQIEDLLNQLRQLQDLQVTIEVRFIRALDNFYEQIGIDFDMDINDNADRDFQLFGRQDQSTSTAFTAPAPNDASGSSFIKGSGNPARNVQDQDINGGARSVTVGMSAPGVFSTDLDIPFTQSTLATAAGALTAIPSFSATSPGGANVGFAILSDIEAYFFITAVQDDNRSNILQAPKVTMFNGQQAFVSDTSQSPFVVSVIPVVGDFAAAQQPVIVVLNEGTSLSVQAVVSNDRRFVRLTLVPFFSQIGDVNTFTFEGSTSSTRNTSSATTGPGTQNDTDEETTTTSGTTVQLPTFNFQTVTTTVSVPDGGTVLLGGIKRMTEVRRENGVPLLSKLPYINRLFENVAIGKASESIMMMVTPRIIIQSEEEEALNVSPLP